MGSDGRRLRARPASRASKYVFGGAVDTIPAALRVSGYSVSLVP